MRLIERDAVLAEAHRCIRRAREGTPSTLLVTGALGMGRTAVLDSIDDTPDDVLSIRISCAPQEQEFGLGVVSQVAYAGLDIDAQDSMSALVDTAAQQSPVDPTILRRIHRLFATDLTRRPVVLLIDDVQWIDDDSARWLAYLSNRNAGWCLGVIATLRDGESGGRRDAVRALVASADVTYPLTPLSRSGSAAAMATWMQADSGDAVDLVRAHRISRGNPLLLRAETEDPDGRRRIRDRIGTSLRGLDPRVRAAATAIAVLDAGGGHTVDHATAAATAGLDPIDFDAATARCRSLGILVDSADLVVHPLIREAATATADIESLDLMHQRAVEALAIEGVSAERMARHVLAAGVTPRSDMVPVLLTAAADARRRGAPTTASDHLRHALMLARDHEDDRISILLDLADVERGYAPSEADRHLDQALALIDDPRTRAEAIVSVAPSLFRMPDGGPETRTARAIEDLRAMTAPIAAEPQLRLRTRFLYQGHDNGRTVRESVALLQALDPDPPLTSAADREHLAVLLNAAALTNARPAAEIAAMAHRILDHEPPTAEHAHGSLTALVPTLIAADDTRGADRWLTEALGHAMRLDLPFVHQIVDVELTLLHASRGDLRTATTHLHSATSRSAPEREPAENLLTLAAATIALQSGDPGTIDAALERAHGKSDNPALSGIIRLLLAAAAAARGQLQLALENYVACGRRMVALGWEDGCVLPWALGAIEIHHLLGHHREVSELIEQEQARVDAWGTPAARGRLLRTRARTTTGSAARELLAESLDVLTSSENQLELYRTAVVLADDFDDQGSGILAERLALHCGVRRPSAGPRMSGPGSRDLTVAERQVATLAMDGATNSAIALRLGVTVRAVEKHLTNTYRKLNISGRTELSHLEIS